MKWVLQSNQTALVHEYHLVENHQRLLTLKYNPIHRSARINTASLHKLFYIESTGSLTGKYLLKNEYNMEIGQLNHQPWMGRDGRVQVEGSEFSYKITTGSEASIAIYRTHEARPIIQCTLEGQVEGLLWAAGNAIGGNCLLLSLCWYLHLGVANHSVLANAS